METLEFNLQWAGPIPFIDRFLKLFSIPCSSSVQTLCYKFCSVAAHSSAIYLEWRPSLLAAAIFFFSLNVATNDDLSAQFGVQTIEVAVERGENPLGWLKNNQFVAATGISSDDVAPVYSQL